MIDKMSKMCTMMTVLSLSLCCGPPSSCECIKTFNPPHHIQDLMAHL